MKILTAETPPCEIVIKRSRFIAEIFCVDSPEKARQKLKEQKARYADARHVVHAFVIGKNGEVNGCSDDGEPGGTAGKPVLEVLKGSEITNCMVTVTRYFGGVLLGTGGLVRAYTQATQGIIANTSVKEWIECCTIAFSCSYADYQVINRHFERFDAEILNIDFNATIDIQLEMPLSEKANFEAFITDSTKGQSTCHQL